VTRVAIIGIGQSLRGDDAAGLEAIRQWREQFPETAGRLEVRVEASELPGLALLDLLNGAQSVVLVDAVQSPHPPGTIHRLNEDQLTSFTSDAKSAHGWGLAETLKLGSQVMKNRPNIRVIGITAEQFAMGTGLSDAVKDAIPKVCKIIEEEVNALLD
jgi:hydrogenase maturation protease